MWKCRNKITPDCVYLECERWDLLHKNPAKSSTLEEQRDEFPCKTFSAAGFRWLSEKLLSHTVHIAVQTFPNIVNKAESYFQYFVEAHIIIHPPQPQRRQFSRHQGQQWSTGNRQLLNTAVPHQQVEGETQNRAL